MPSVVHLCHNFYCEVILVEKHGVAAVARLDDYDPKQLSTAVAAQLEHLEVIPLLTPQTRVTLKPNLLLGRAPSQAVTTHPAVIQAVVDSLRELGVTKITLADSPGGPYTPARLRSVYRACGLNALRGVELNLDVGWQQRYYAEGQVCKSFNLINPIVEADLVINLAKLKTHGMTVMSGAVKNLFGTVPGLQKPELHYLYPKKTDFVGMLIDLSLLVAPALTIVDAIEAQEGEGPSAGTPRHMGCLFAARDPYSLDWVMAQAMGLEPTSVDLLRVASERGLIEPEKITILGRLPEQSAAFKLPHSASLLFADKLPLPLQKPFSFVASRLLRPLPHVRREQCTGCGRCAESCPPHTITIRNGKAVIDTGRCISCFCCHEMCPAKAIAVKRRIRL